MGRGADTRERILDIAQAAVLAKGFSGTSIDELVAEADITKSGFFYHFKDKGELAKSLLQRYLDEDRALLDGLFDRADELHEDPLHGFLIGLKMFAELMADLPETHPGCLVAAVCYHENLFSRDVAELNAAGVLEWRERFRNRLQLIAERYPPRIEVDLDDVADLLSGAVEGGIIISKAINDKDVLPRQILLSREFVRAIFLGS